MVKAVVGANWGDEGKGKITDMLAREADIIVRFQGGANAGHTIVNDYGKFADNCMIIFLSDLCKININFSTPAIGPSSSSTGRQFKLCL